MIFWVTVLAGSALLLYWQMYWWTVVYAVSLILMKWLSTPYSQWKKRIAQKQTFTLYKPGNTAEEIDLKNTALDLTADVYLSVIFPAYNERERLPETLEATITYLERKQAEKAFFSSEIIIVDDGSQDDTIQLALDIGKRRRFDLKVIRCSVNGGKGAAVRIGMLCSRGMALLFADSDNATDIRCLDAVLKSLEDNSTEGYGFACGSRNSDSVETVRKRKPIRDFLNWGFMLFVRTLCSTELKDTQCGFKMFTRRAAQKMFPVMHIERYAFDVELLYLAKCFGIPVSEVPVNWEEMPGSKVNILTDSFKIARDILMVRVLYFIGLWSTKDVSIPGSRA
mmetsp:Transcript_19775/g.36433  ORF Transcript_19775/g.36433 Transcript_19775/m.36433 type:complete len:338 (+) Transcript_19775:107-1120(+)